MQSDAARSAAATKDLQALSVGKNIRNATGLRYWKEYWQCHSLALTLAVASLQASPRAAPAHAHCMLAPALLVMLLSISLKSSCCQKLACQLRPPTNSAKLPPSQQLLCSPQANHSSLAETKQVCITLICVYPGRNNVCILTPLILVMPIYYCQDDIFKQPI